MLSRSLRAKLFVLPVVVAICGVTWLAYRPQGYRYEFRIQSHSTDEAIGADVPAPPAEETRWEGHALERNWDLPVFGNRRRSASIVTHVGEMPVRADTLAKGTSFRTQTGRRDMGQGEEIAGFATRKLVLTADDTLYVEGDDGHHRLARTARTETVVWLTTDVENVGRRFTYLADSINMLASGRSPRAIRQRHREGNPRFDGVPLKLVSTVVAFDSLGRRRETVTTSEILNLDRRWVGAREIDALALDASRLEHERRGRSLAARRS